MLIRAIQVRRFPDPCGQALKMAAKRMKCDVSDLVVVLLSSGDREVIRTASAAAALTTKLAARVEFWMRHIGTGKYLTTCGLMSSLEFNGGKIQGYFSESAARISLNTQAVALGITWDDLEKVTL